MDSFVLYHVLKFGRDLLREFQSFEGSSYLTFVVPPSGVSNSDIATVSIVVIVQL